MKVLFVYPKSNPLISRHVSMLTDGLQQSVTIGTADSVGAIRKAVKEQEPDIIHCHGLPSVSAVRAILSGINKGSRLVLTLHGQMEPWATDKNKKMPAIYWQKRLITRAYSVILLGRLELTNFKKLGWNRRTEEIHNAVTTNTISLQEMCAATFAVYQKVMDSNTLELMDEPTVRMLRIAAYFPDHYETPKPIREKVGDYNGKETDYLVRIIHQLRQQPLLLHLIELTRELYRDTVDDEQLAERLEEKKLTAFTRSLIQVLDEQTALDEGYMPLPPADNRLTRQIRQQLDNHLNIED